MEKITRNFENAKFWSRNSKVLVVTEVLFGIPTSWVFFYQPIFMKNMGLSEVLIGFFATLPLIFQMFLPVLGGFLADRYGRKRVLMLFDTIGWTGTMSIWFVAREPWQIIVAMLFQGLTTTTYGVWETLLLEDTEQPYRPSIYCSIQIIYVFAGLLTPIAGVLVSSYGVEQGCRNMFLIALVNIATMFIIRQVFLGESKIGKILSSQNTQNTSPSGSGYTNVMKIVREHKKLLILFALAIIGSMQYPLFNTFRPLYLSDSRALGLDEGIISIIPMASSIPSIIALSFIIPRLRHEHIRRALLFSYMCGLLGLATFIIAPRGSLILAVLSALLDSARFVAIFSILRAFIANTIDEIDPFARSKIMSLIYALSALASWPIPIIGGYLYAADPVLPFVLGAMFLAASIGLTLNI